MLSKAFVEAVKLAPMRNYQLAHQAGLHPATLSRIINGIDRVRPGDPRVLRVGRILGLDAAACFKEGGLAERFEEVPQ